MAITAIQELPAVGRKLRHPSHTFHLRQRPWQIQPFAIAPVLPGETLKNALLQVRAVTDPIKNPLIGWWAEYYIFYVKHRDLEGRDDFTAMMLNYEHDLSAYNTAANTARYHPGPGIDWVNLCYARVVEEYFRDEGEANPPGYGGLQLAQIGNQTWLDSVIDATVFNEGTPPAGDGTETPQELDQMQRQYEFMRANQLINMSYEDFLRTYGVRLGRVEQHRPELIRYVKDWKYPANTIDPADGSPSSAVSWAVSERADKDRFFTEPGFIFGVSVFRPKVYLSGQKGAAVSMLDNALSWLPAIMRDEPYTSLREFAAGTGPLQGTTNGYWVDVRDLFLYGDQFLNFALTETNAGLVALPTAGLTKKYPVSADADALFVSASPSNQIRQDGVLSLHILGAQVDHT